MLVIFFSEFLFMSLFITFQFPWLNKKVLLIYFQAKLLSMTRTAPKRRPSSPETPMHTPVTHRRPGVSNFVPNAKKAFSKTTVSRPKSKSPVRVGGSPTRSEHSRICESPYDTPNPRSKAPKPVAYNNSAIETSDTQLANHRSNNNDCSNLKSFENFFDKFLIV